MLKNNVKFESTEKTSSLFTNYYRRLLKVYNTKKRFLTESLRIRSFFFFRITPVLIKILGQEIGCLLYLKFLY